MIRRSLVGSTAVTCLVVMVALSPTATAEPTKPPATPSGPLMAMRVDTAKLWSLSRGSGQIVAVIDTGVQASVPELAGTLSETSRDFTGRGAPGRDTSADSHGTSVAAVIAGRGRQGSGVIGVAPSASIMSVRVATDTDDLNALTLAEGVSYAATHGADVINLSLTAETTTPQLTAAIAQAVHVGAVVVAAAGNAGDQGNPAYYPARLPGVIAVGGSRGDRRPWPQSETGEDVDLAGLAVGVPSVNASGTASIFAGTTYSAAAVSGTVALLRARFPKETVSQLEQRLASTARPLRRPVPNDVGGYGIADPLAALLAIEPSNSWPSPFVDPHRHPRRPAMVFHASRSNRAQFIVFIGIGVLIVAGGVSIVARRRRGLS